MPDLAICATIDFYLWVRPIFDLCFCPLAILIILNAPSPYIKYIIVIKQNQEPHDQLSVVRPLALYEKDNCICFLILTFIALRVSKVIPSILLMRTSDKPSMTLNLI